MFNQGLIITTSNAMRPDMKPDAVEKLNNEYIRRNANARIMQTMFARCHIAATRVNSPTLFELKQSLARCFADTTPDSYSYIYINCHGSPDGLALVMGPRGRAEHISYSDLRNILDVIPGTKVLLIESCHSGGSIASDDSSDRAVPDMTRSLEFPDPEPRTMQENIARAFGDRFPMMRRQGEFRRPSYHVLAACSEEHSAWGNNGGNFLTRSWAEAVGVDPTKTSYMTHLLPADRNRDHFVSLGEIQAYSRAHPVYDEKTRQYLYDQNDICYPEGDETPVFGSQAVYRGMFDNPPRSVPSYCNSALIITASNPPGTAKTSDGKRHLEEEKNRRDYNARLAARLFGRCQIESRHFHNPYKRGLEGMFQRAFASATPSSYSYIYINCHGNTKGLNMAMDGDRTTMVTYKELRQMLEKIPGTKVLFIESCHSGASIAARSMKPQTETAETAEQVNRAVIQAFAESPRVCTRRMGELRRPQFRVLAACEKDQSAWGRGDDKGNIFTRAWCWALGIDPETLAERPYFPADRDNDSFVTLDDLVAYTGTYHAWDDTDQDDICYPANDPTPVLGSRALYDGLFDRNGRSIQEYYDHHRFEFGTPAGPFRDLPGCQYRNYQKGVIVQYDNGLVEGFHRMRYDLLRLYQTAFMVDGHRNHPDVDDDLELYLTVSVRENDEETVALDRWPAPGPKKIMTGGDHFDVTVDGRSIDWRRPDRNVVHYDTGILTGETRFKLTLRVMDYDGELNDDDLLGIHTFNFGVETGWGLVKPQTRTCSEFLQAWDTALYRGVWANTRNVRLDFMVSKTR